MYRIIDYLRHRSRPIPAGQDVHGDPAANPVRSDQSISANAVIYGTPTC